MSQVKASNLAISCFCFKPLAKLRFRKVKTFSLPAGGGIETIELKCTKRITRFDASPPKNRFASGNTSSLGWSTRIANFRYERRNDDQSCPGRPSRDER